MAGGIIDEINLLPGVVEEVFPVEGNEIAYNRDYSGTKCGWECGGLEFSLTNRLTVRANRIHHNVGPGLWTDGDCINTLYEDNTVVENEQGTFHEISYRATIRDNTILRNGSASADRNRNSVYDINRRAYWTWDDKEQNWSSFRARGQEANGSASSMPIPRSPIGIPKASRRR